MNREEELRTSSETIHNMLYDSDMILGVKEWNALRIAEETMKEVAGDLQRERKAKENLEKYKRELWDKKDKNTIWIE